MKRNVWPCYDTSKFTFVAISTTYRLTVMLTKTSSVQPQQLRGGSCESASISTTQRERHLLQCYSYPPNRASFRILLVRWLSPTLVGGLLVHGGNRQNGCRLDSSAGGGKGQPL